MSLLPDLYFVTILTYVAVPTPFLPTPTDTSLESLPLAFVFKLFRMRGGLIYLYLSFFDLLLWDRDNYIC